jgi:hypothetical protein
MSAKPILCCKIDDCGIQFAHFPSYPEETSERALLAPSFDYRHTCLQKAAGLLISVTGNHTLPFEVGRRTAATTSKRGHALPLAVPDGMPLLFHWILKLRFHPPELL